MPRQRSLYDQLGVLPTASAGQIRSAYRRAARRAHPDAGGSPLAFDRLTAAYRVLADPTRRRSYDRWLAAGRDDRRFDASAASRPARAARPGADRRVLVRYLAMMLVAVSLFVAAGTIVRLYSLAAAAVMMVVAMLIPPTAAIMANRPRGPADAGPADAGQDGDGDPGRPRCRR
jgi:DnaJ domain